MKKLFEIIFAIIAIYLIFECLKAFCASTYDQITDTNDGFIWYLND